MNGNNNNNNKSDIKNLLSKKECETILHRYFGKSEDCELLDYYLKPLSENIEGFLGDHFWLTIRSKSKNEESEHRFFVKVEPLDHDLQLDFTRSMNAFESEIFFYKTLITEFKRYYPNFDESILPKYYFSRDKNLIVLEDCTSQGYEIADGIHEMDLNHIRVVLKNLAKFHTASIVYEERKSEELGQPFRLIDSYGDYMAENLFTDIEETPAYQWQVSSIKCVDTIIDLMPDLEEMSKDQFKTKFHQMAQQSRDIVKPNTKFRNVCCHADLWRKNILFKYENRIPVKCMLIDFQLIKYNPPIYDVLKYLHLVTSLETRKNHIHPLLSYYYNQLREELKLENFDIEQILPQDQFQESLKYMLPVNKIETLYYYTFQKAGFEYLKTIVIDNESYKKFVFVDRSFVAEEFYTKGTDFKKWIDEILLEIKDHLILERRLLRSH